MEETNEMNVQAEENLESVENEEINESNEEVVSASNANETKNEKFIRLAEYRVNKIMTAISSLDKLHNRSSYDYTDEQVNLMFETIENQLNEVKEHFGKVKVQEAKFSFNMNK